MKPSAVSSPLEGIQVVDLTQLLPGVLTTQILGDLGAEVIKVEPPRTGDKTRWIPPLIGSQGAIFCLINRNKRSLTLDLKSEQGRRILERLVRRADLLVEGFRPGVMERLGLGLDRLREENPRLITCSITGYGATGPWKDRAGHDLNYQALAGLVSQGAGSHGGPAVPGAPVADIGGGTWPAVAGILAALLQRERTGGGQAVDVSMADGAALFSVVGYAMAAAGAPEGGPGRGPLTGALPTYGLYRCADGRYISIAFLGMIERKFWVDFARAVGREEWAERDVADEALRRDLATLFAERPLAEWMETLGHDDMCVAPVLEPEEVRLHHHMSDRGVFFDCGHPGEGAVPAIATPFKLSAQGDLEHRPPPALGEDTDMILEELGFDRDEIDVVRKRGVV